MTDLEVLLDRLAGDEPAPFDVDELERRVARRRTGRRLAIGGVLAAILLAAGIGLVVAGGPGTIEAVEPADPTTTSTTVDDETGWPDADPAVAREALAAVDAMLAAMAAGDYETAADRWSPMPSAGPPIEAEQEAWLAEACGDDGCRQPYEVRLARPIGEGDIYEVLVEFADERTPFAVTATVVDDWKRWQVIGTPPTFDLDADHWLDRALEPLDPDRPAGLIVARPSGFEVVDDGASRFVRSNTALEVPPYVVEGHWHRPGRWGPLVDDGTVCPFPEIIDDSMAAAFSIFRLGPGDGRWITELGLSGLEIETVLWDCEAQAAATDLDHLQSDFTFQEMSRTLVSDGEWIVQATESGGPSVLQRPDGTPISDDDVSEPVLDGSTGTVAYRLADEDGPVEPPQIVVRSTTTGDEIGTWELDEQPFQFDFDGRFIVAVVGSRSLVPVPSPFTVDRELVVIDTVTGNQVSVPAPIIGAWLG